jgi:hypothetical protein
MSKSNTKVIADYLRYQTNDSKLSDSEAISLYGGEDTNTILKNMGGGKYIYYATTSTPEGVIHFVTVIDEIAYSKSKTLEF